MSEPSHRNIEVCVSGMTCRSCEITIERAWKKVPGVKTVHVDLAKGRAMVCADVDYAIDCGVLTRILPDPKYSVSLPGEEGRSFATVSTRPSFLRLVGLFALVLALGAILSKFDLLKPNFNTGTVTSFGAVFLIGLVAASSSCMAVAGGLLLSASARFNERYGSKTGFVRFWPVLLFVIGRVVGYAVLGGLLGVVGGVLTPPPLVTALITVVAAVYMIIMGLEMLHLAPSWLKRFLPGMSKTVSHRIVDAEAKKHPAMPFLLGAATFFLPCGFTQALQLYALTTGSFWTASSIMLAFALGTAPALLALGYASSSLKGKIGGAFFRFSGALVIVLGLWNIQNGFVMAGYPLSFSAFSSPSTASQMIRGPMEIDVDVIKMNADYRGYTPNKLQVRAGVPVRWEITGAASIGCASVLQSRSLGIRQLLVEGPNVIELRAPTKPGVYSFSCSMGMYRGEIDVI